MTPSSPTLPTPADVRLALEAGWAINHLLANGAGPDVPLRIRMAQGKGEVDVVLPAAALVGLSQILAEMAHGNAAQVVPVPAEMTLNQAADFLNVLPIFVADLVKKGELPVQNQSVRQRFLYVDVLAYQNRQRVAQKAALDELSRQAQEMGLYEPEAS